MKFLRNLLIATTAVAAMSATAAFAETTNDFALDDYNAENNTISVTADDATAGTTNMTTLVNAVADDGEQVTVVVVPLNAGTIDESEILYINQDSEDTASTMLTNMGLAEALKSYKDSDGKAVTDFEVRVGGSNGTIKVATFTTVSAPTHPNYPLGDADLSGTVTAGDASRALGASLGNIDLIGDAFECADADKSGALTAGDASKILAASLGNIELNW